ncbi:MAG TPA: DMT family transporter [Gaiellaceae bacterium]|nr:DMT family transporter [Gaiellaceae bacterium]
MDAVLLALASAFLFGAMTVALRFALRRAPDAEVGALLTIVPALVVTLPFVAAQSIDLGGIWPFVLAGLLGPGLSQLLFTLAVRDAGPSRTSVAVGTAPLFSVVLALIFLDEPLRAGLVLGALLIVVGGVMLVGERGRPEHVKRIGLVLAVVAAVVFAVRDNLVRWLSIDTDVSPALAAAATLGAGGLCVAAYVLATRSGRVSFRRLPVFVPAGLLFGLSYICLFEAYYRGRVTVVSPLVATESLWGVGLSALLLRRHELVGPRLLAGAALVVAGGALIGVFR